MTEYTPTPEAVEAAARASYESFMARMTRHFAEHGVTLRPARPWEEMSDMSRETFREDAERALTAAGPLIAAEALRGSGGGQSCGCAWCCSQNAASVIPGKGHEICPAQRGRRILRGEAR